MHLDRLILSGHSGGGMPAVDAIAGAARPPDEFYAFDGLYGRDPSLGDPMQGLEIIDAWLAARFAAEPDRPGALRVIYIERQTGPFSREVQRLIARRLAKVDPNAAPASLCAPLSGRAGRRCRTAMSPPSAARNYWRMPASASIGHGFSLTPIKGCHCEEPKATRQSRAGEAPSARDCFASLAMTWED